MNDKYNVAVVGATGLVGRTMLKVLEERNFPVDEISCYASSRSAEKSLNFKGNEIRVKELTGDAFENEGIALFSAGKGASVNFAPIAVKKGCVVIDNGSYWRMDSRVPLIVPEVNPEALAGHRGLIANPNCSTIQLVVALKPLHDLFHIKRVIVSTYQSISGAGQKGLNQLHEELSGEESTFRKHRIAGNAIFHTHQSDGYTVEEIKMVNETRKILRLHDLKIAVTCVRLPFEASHGESVNIEFEKPFRISEIRQLFKDSEGIVLIDDMAHEEYPTPLLAAGTDPVYVGRIRRDYSVENGLMLWVVADNVRKGAATNAVQIAEKLVSMDLMGYDKNIFVFKALLK